MDNSNAIVMASSRVGLCELTCDECEHTLIAATMDKFCPECGSSTSQVDKENISISASIEEDIDAILTCATCETTILSNSTESSADLAATQYCVSCGSGEVDAMDEDTDEDIDEVVVVEDEHEKEKEKEKDLMLQEKEDTAVASEDEVKEKLSDTESLEAVLLTEPNPQWVIFSAGRAVLAVHQEKQPEESHYLFGKTEYIEVFLQRAKETGLFSAAKEFNADILDTTAIVDQRDIEEIVYDRLQANVLPKFLDCVNLAVEGMVRNIYPTLANELKASFYDELKARGVTDASAVIDASFSASGSDVFSAVIAKAMELYNKPDDIRKELRATILNTSGVKHGVTTETDLESLEIGSKLVAGNLAINPTSEPIAANIHSSTVDHLRTRLGLSTKN